MRACVLIESNKCLVCLKHTNTHPDSDTVLFLYVGYYIMVYLQGYFLHCINTRQQEMLCHSLFLSGKVMSQIDVKQFLLTLLLSYNTSMIDF